MGRTFDQLIFDRGEKFVDSLNVYGQTYKQARSRAAAWESLPCPMVPHFQMPDDTWSE